LTEDCYEIEQLCAISPNEGAIYAGRTLLKRLLPCQLEWRWIEIRNNMQTGIIGTGQGYSLIHALAQRGHYFGVQLLLEKSADVNAQDNDGTTVFQYSSLSGNKQLVRMLLEYSALKLATQERVAINLGTSPTVKEVVELDSTVPRSEGEVAQTAETLGEFTPVQCSLEHDQSILVLMGLLMEHPDSGQLQKELSEAFRVKSDYDEAITGWQKLWEMFPYRLSILRSLREACRLKWALLKETSLVRFAWLCSLSFLSRKFREWDLRESDWSPLATEDEIMMVTPYTIERVWRCVFLISVD